MADSLESNFVLEDDYQPGSNATGSSSSKQSKAQKQHTNGKRPRSPSADVEDDDDFSDDDESKAMRTAAGASSAQQKQKRKERQKARKARLAVRRQEEEEARVNTATLPPEFQADWLRKEFRRIKTYKDLSEIEMDEVVIPQKSLVDSTSWKGSRDEEDLAPFVKSLFSQVVADAHKDDSTVRSAKASPAILVISNNALRASHLARELRGVLPSAGSPEAKDKEPKAKKRKPDSATKADSNSSSTTTSTATTTTSASTSLHIAKLFSRHFTTAEQSTFLSSHNILAGVGTAQRVAVLIQSAALKLDNLQAVVLDAGWRDEKMRGLLDEDGGRQGVKDVWEAVRVQRPQAKVVLF